MDYSIEVHKLTKMYENKVAVDHISFQVEKGEIFAFLGPNGAGKSTTISMIDTLVEADSGHIVVEQCKMGIDNQKIRSMIGIVFQESMLDEILSVYQNLMFRCGLYHIYKKQAEARVKELANLCGLQDFLHQRVSTLSGGQRRSADIARALIPSPKILILDEPSTSLDPKSRKQLWETICYLHEQQRMTVLMTTHYMEEAEIADHICIIQNGKLLVDKKKEALKQEFGRHKLFLYPTSLHAIQDVLTRNRMPYQVVEDRILMEPLNHFHTMSILRKCEQYLVRFEYIPEKIEDVYLRLLREGESHENIDQT